MAEQPEAQIYSTSVKIEQTAKGAAMVTVHVYDNDGVRGVTKAIELFEMTITALKAKGHTVASEVAK